MLFRKPARMPNADEALPGRDQSMPVSPRHFVSGASMQPDTKGLEVALFGLGCFWGAERKFWEMDDIVTTAVGYTGGLTPNPSYEEVCSGLTGHNEVVRVVYDPALSAFSSLLKTFWENHDPTQGMQQGNDVGTQYRSGIYCTSDEQLQQAERSREAFRTELSQGGYGPITTEIVAASNFYFAEDYHQQYLAKNPNGYCGLGGTGISCPIGLKDVVSA